MAVVELEEARERVLAHARALTAEPIGLGEALGRVLAADVTADADVPAFDNSAMDGFAVRAADSAPGARLRVVDESRAGTPAAAVVGEGEACAISTGAAMPAGADAIIRVEDTRVADGVVELLVAVERDHDVRHAGSDVRAGDVVLRAGTRLDPSQLGVLASVGRSTLLAGPRPRVALVTTGDELIAVDAPLGPGEVRNSGAHVIPALVERSGGVCVSVAHARDDPEEVRATIGAALECSDVTVITGGMSVGRHDHVAEALAVLGVELHVDGIALRPGKPTSFGTRGAALVFGLPGNPVSSFVTFLLLARPALLALAGEHPARLRTTAILDAPCERLATRMQAVRCRLTLAPDGWHAIATGPQSSHILSSMLGADALALIDAGTGAADAGERVVVELL
ncbi:MAG: molybdopterin molybdotransferase MoeA [Solirubrobacteraceae bacterium]